MPTIEKRGNSYRVIVSDGYNSKGKKILHKKTFKKPNDMTEKKWGKEINRLAYAFEMEIQRGIIVNQTTSLEEFTAKWLKEYAEVQLQPKTLSTYKYELERKILPALGHVKLHKLTPLKILNFLNSLIKDGVRIDGKPGGYSDRTIRYQKQILSSILQQAVYWQVLPDNPCTRVKVPKNNAAQPNTKVQFLNETQVTILLEAIKSESLKYQVATHIAILCGLRIGEILGLTWDDIDFKTRTMSINKVRQRVHKIGMIVKIPKNRSSIRNISMPNTLVKLLIEYKLWQNGEKAKCGDLWSSDWTYSPWLLTQWNGAGMDYNSLTHWLVKFINRYNDEIKNNDSIPEDLKINNMLPVISFHKLRHTSATLLINKNANIKAVSSRLGHSQTSTTLNIYVHSMKCADEMSADLMDEMFSKDKKNNKIV
jgi:integrase